jgi:hypothetical protein
MVSDILYTDKPRKPLMAKKVNKYIYWIPRIFSILFIMFLTLFSLDVFDLNLGFWGTILAFLIHSIPSIVLTIILIIAWRYELVGGIAFILAALAYIILLIVSAVRSGQWFRLAWSMTIAGPAFAIGILYLIGWKQKTAK